MMPVQAMTQQVGFAILYLVLGTTDYQFDASNKCCLARLPDMLEGCMSVDFPLLQMNRSYYVPSH